MRGYSYDRRDVTGRGLANAYAQTLGTIFSSGGEKPYEVELFVAEVGDDAPSRTRSTGSPTTARSPTSSGYAVMGGSAEQSTTYLGALPAWPSLSAALALAVEALGQDGNGNRRRSTPPARGRRARPDPHPAAQVPPAGGAGPGSAAHGRRVRGARPAADQVPDGTGESPDSPPGGTSGDTPLGEQPGVLA